MHASRWFGFAATLWLLGGCSSDIAKVDGTDGSLPADAREDAASDASCDGGQYSGWSCPETYTADPAQLCRPLRYLRILTTENATTRNITFNAGIGAWSCCYDANGALTGEHIRDDVLHPCWGPNGAASNETSIGVGCWIPFDAPEVDCGSDAGTPDAEPADLGPTDSGPSD